MNQEIVVDVGGVLSYSPASTRRPSSATVTLVTPAGATHVASQSATAPPSTTLTSGATAGATSLAVASATGIEAGGYYVLADDDGQTEQVRVVRVATLTLHLAAPIAYDYDSGDRLFGRRFTVAVTSGQATPRAEGYEARWIVTYADATVERVVTLWDVVRSRWPDDLVDWPAFRRHAGSQASAALEAEDAEGLQFRDELEEATDRVRRDLLALGHRSGLFRSFESFVRPICLAVVLKWAEDGVNLPQIATQDPDGWRMQRQEIYDQALTQALNVTRSYDEDDSGVVDDSERDQRFGTVRLIT